MFVVCCCSWANDDDGAANKVPATSVIIISVSKVRDDFGIMTMMRQIILSITHVGSVMTYVISDAVRKPGHVLTSI